MNKLVFSDKNIKSYKLLLQFYTNMMYDHLHHNLGNKNQNSMDLRQWNRIAYNYSSMSHKKFRKEHDESFAIEGVNVE